MIYARMLAVCTMAIVCSTPALQGQGLSHYRDFELGSGVSSVSSLAGVASSEVKTIHQRPALLQDFEWRPSPWVSGSTEASTDPVEQILFSFYDDQLFRVMVEYAQARTEGMVGQDMIDAVSGPTARRARAHLARVAQDHRESRQSRVRRWHAGEMESTRSCCIKPPRTAPHTA